MNRQKLIWTLGCLSALTGCSSLYSSKEYSALHVKPVMHVQHANTSAQNLYHLARYHHWKTSHAKAIALYQKVLAVNPDHVEAHNGLGVIYSTQRQHQLALQHFQKAIEITPAATYLYNNLGYAHLLQGQHSEAAVAFQEALRFDPHNHKARRNLATAHKQMGITGQIADSSTAAAAAVTSAATKEKSEAYTAAVAQALPVQPNARQQLVQIAPNVYEFRVNHEKPKITPAATPVTAPLAAAPAVSSPRPTSIAHAHSEKPAPEKTASVAENKRIEISNGNGVTGMARNIATFLKQFGFDNARLTNHQTFQQAQTEIHYHPGAYTFAEQISQIMPGQVKIIENNELRADIKLKILLGKDIASEIAYFTTKKNIQLAQHISPQ
ncbi:LytR C-terminal domain-containing protein [Nitrosomonas communis]|uniref:LytR C-terminal domain-containing protein n=1 Tax=Nitrosomonas communis TaxID=44574 RepID=UPI0026EA954C|nr:LytR C-terminal domain-containing protein [Nitrosomonas communis]MCO6428429.1 tetratricopeptide repeat protein [Nitrosomonas communis]